MQCNRMSRSSFGLLTIVWITWISLPVVFQPAQASCQGGVAVQVLGSGGPVADSLRASAGYVLWIDGESRLLIDAGGGTFSRFANAGADVGTLDAVALTHLHVDHAVELPAYLKNAWFGQRSRPLVIIGPSGAGDYPDLESFIHSLVGPDDGAFRYLKGYVQGGKDYFPLRRITVDHVGRKPLPAYFADDLSIKAVGVNHGPVPALGYLVEARGQRIAFSGDQNGDNPAFGEMIRGADVLVMDHAVPENTDDVAAGLHARPSEIAKLAGDAAVKRLVLSHLMPRSERQLEHSLTLITKRFAGEVSVAEDLMCIELPSRQNAEGARSE